MTGYALVSDTVTTIVLAFLAFLLIAACVTTWLAQYGEQALSWLAAHPIRHPHFTWPAFSLPSRVPPAGGYHRLEKPVIRVSDLLDRQRQEPVVGRGRHWMSDALHGETGMHALVQLPLDPTTVVVDGELVTEVAA